MDFREMDRERCELDLHGSIWGPVVGSCEHGIEIRMP